MELLGIGPLELIFILLIVLLILGPEELAATGKKLGRFLRALNRSETWRSIRKTGEELRSLPTKLMREAEIESYLAENPDRRKKAPAAKTEPEQERTPEPKELEEGIKAWTTPPSEDKESQ